MTHANFHQTKFRWTENLTSRFIQLRKENGNLFTGRKYSAQAGWEHILQQMRQEFPTIMADVHYRVLKKKWSNLLQQYKELKNPVHGDKNKSDDVSWPFYGAIDEVLGYGKRNNHDENNDDDHDDLNPHEFLCLSVTPEEPASPEDEQRLLDSDADHETVQTVTAIKRIRNFNQDFSIQIERLPRVPIRRARPSSRPSRICQELRLRDASEVLVSRLPPATELSIKTVKSSSSSSSSAPGLRVRKFSNNKEEKDDSPRQFLHDALVVNNGKINGNYNNELEVEEADEEDEEEEEEEVEEEEDGEEEGEGEELEEDYDEEKERPRKLLKRLETATAAGSVTRLNNNKCFNECGNKLEKRFIEFMDYTKRRDEENRIIMTRILNAVERIAEKK